MWRREIQSRGGNVSDSGIRAFLAEMRWWADPASFTGVQQAAIRAPPNLGSTFQTSSTFRCSHRLSLVFTQTLAFRSATMFPEVLQLINTIRLVP